MLSSSIIRYSFFLVVTLLLLSVVQASAQKYLVFDVIPKSKRYRFQIGQELTFKLNKEDKPTTGVITELGIEYLVLDNLDNIRVDQIKYVKVERNGPWSGVRDVTGYVVPVLGVGYLALETIDNLNTGQEEIFRAAPVTAAIVSVAYGIYMATLKRKTYKVNDNHRLYILDMGDGPLHPDGQ